LITLHNASVMELVDMTDSKLIMSNIHIQASH
jgi:hypothetical protein